MTLNEFISDLASHEISWQLLGHKRTAIRTVIQNHELCPMEFAVFLRKKTSASVGSLLPWECGDILGLAAADRQAIMRASDNVILPELSVIHRSDYELRKRLLMACRLEG